MADLKQEANEEPSPDSACDSTDITQVSLKTQTSSLKNNASCLPEQLSSDIYEKPLNGAQPALFVHSSAPAASIAERTLPSETVVNGPVSHTTSDKLCTLKKASVSLSNTQATGPSSKTSSPHVLQPPNEHEMPTKLDTKKTAQPAVKGFVPDSLTTQKDGRAKKCDVEEQSKAEETVLSEETSDETPISHTKTRQEVNHGSTWDFSLESSESSSDEYESHDLNWDPQKEFMRFLWDDDENDVEKEEEAPPQPSGQRRRKRKMDIVEMDDISENVWSDLNHASKRSKMDGAPEYEEGFQNTVSHKKVHSLRKKPHAESSVKSGENYPSETVEAIKQLILSSPAKNHLDENDDDETEGLPVAGGKLKPIKTEPSAGLGAEQEPSFFPCTKCNVNFKEKKHLHRHMMYHLDGNNQFRHVNVPRPFICRECGRSFRDRNSLLKHMIIHQERREKLMEEIKGMNELQDEGRNDTCVFGTNCPKTFFQHAKTHEKDKRYYCCDECNFMAVTENELECHQVSAHTKYGLLSRSQKSVSYACKICPFSTLNKNVLKKHVELIHQQQYHEEHDWKSQKIELPRLQLKPKFCMEKPAFRNRSETPFLSDGFSDLFRKNKNMQKARKGILNSKLTKWSLSNAASQLSSSRKNEKQNKLFFQQNEKIDVTTGLPYAEDSDGEHEYGGMFPINLEKQSSHTNSYKKSPNKRKMTSPYSDAAEKVTLAILPKPEQNQKQNDGAEDPGEDNYDFSDYTSEATANFLDCNENEQNPYARNYFIRRQRFTSSKDDRGPTSHVFEKSGGSAEKDTNAIQKVRVKEECIETEVCEEAPESGLALHSDPYPTFDVSPFTTERKSCPYCPALFESGVGLSNHVRGHLHRVGLSYDARHVVSPEQVASQDRKPRIRRKITAVRRIKKVDKPESQTEHTCPLCGGWFDTKTGLSNHVRGHLKRIGKTISSTSKSPVCILNEMMQDEEEYKHLLQVLSKKRFFSRPFVSQKFASSDGLFLSPTGIPVKIQHTGQDGKAWGAAVARQEEEGLEKQRTEANPEEKGSPSSTLIELLKKRRQDEEMEICKNRSQTARKRLAASPPKDGSTGTTVKTELTWQPVVPSFSVIPAGILECLVSPALRTPVRVRSGRSHLPHVTGEQPVPSRYPGSASSSPGDACSPVSLASLAQSSRHRCDDVSCSLTGNLGPVVVTFPCDGEVRVCRRVLSSLRLPLPFPWDLSLPTISSSLAWEWGPREKNELNKKVCVHCNTTFPSAVSLSNHLRAYARRKRAALLEGTTYDCKQKKPRSRPGPKKKVFPLPHTADEIYRLTCRFCDLVFQGPLSVQEDWIKHLQRHLMNTSVPRTGAGMVEVTSLPKDAPALPEPSPLLVPQAAS
ncbi:ZN644 protein, partial [Atractosteus spatula]|nr:ZN644 protein [Atractosteus spatula]